MPGNCLSLVAWTEGRCRCETITGRPRRIRALIRSSFDKWSNLSFYGCASQESVIWYLQVILSWLADEEIQGRFDYLDEIYAFFMNCYHLSDWLEDSTISAAVRDRLRLSESKRAYTPSYHVVGVQS